MVVWRGRWVEFRRDIRSSCSKKRGQNNGKWSVPWSTPDATPVAVQTAIQPVLTQIAADGNAGLVQWWNYADLVAQAKAEGLVGYTYVTTLSS